MKNRDGIRMLRIAMWAVLTGSIPVGEILAAEGASIPGEQRPVLQAKDGAQPTRLTPEEVRDLPGRLYRLVLTGDRVLWARSLTRTSGGYEVEPVTGAKVVLKEDGVTQVKQFPRSSYLSERWKQIQTARRATLQAKKTPSLRPR